MKKFWQTSYRSSTGQANYVSTTSAPTVDTQNQFFQWLDEQEDEPDTLGVDEFDLYIHDRFIFHKEDEGQTALEWWLEPEQRTRYPLLSKMAIDIYSIPAMSVEPERVFSGAKRTVSDLRGSLKGETIELLECLKSWFRLGVFTKEDLHAIVGDLDEEGALEAMDQ